MKYENLAPAKINLSLDIVGKLENGYHLLESVMQTIDLADVVLVEESPKTEIFCNHPTLATDSSNLAYKAYAAMAAEFGIDAGVKITIDKHIPLAGGMAGGSTNAAQVILGINEVFNLKATPEKLAEIALGLGADVPFCLTGGTQFAQGVGEKLQRLNNVPELRLLVLNLGFPVPTAEVFQALNMPTGGVVLRNPKTTAMLAAIEDMNPFAISENLFNTLEEPAFRLYPQLAKLKYDLSQMGLAPLLSGSGGTVFAIAPDKKRAARAYDLLAGKYPLVKQATTRIVY